MEGAFRASKKEGGRGFPLATGIERKAKEMERAGGEGAAHFVPLTPFCPIGRREFLRQG